MDFAKIRKKRGCFLELLLCVLVLSIQSCSTHKTVYICTGPSAYAYHEDSDCPLMVTHCTRSIKEVSVSKAIKMKREPCRKCSE